MSSTLALMELAARHQAQGKPVVIATVVRAVAPTSARAGAKAILDQSGIIEGWIGGGCVQPAVSKTVKQVLRDGQPRLVRISAGRKEASEEGIVEFGMSCHSGGELEIFVEPVMQRPCLLIVGESPAARTLATLAPTVGFDVVAAAGGANVSDFPGARCVVDDLGAEELTSLNPDFAVVATQGKRDQEALKAALRSGTQSIAFVASRRKAEKIKAALKKRGHDAQRVEAIIAPAGIDIGAVTPEEIALSVLAGLVKARRALPSRDQTDGKVGRSDTDVNAI